MSEFSFGFMEIFRKTTINLIFLFTLTCIFMQTNIIFA